MLRYVQFLLPAKVTRRFDNRWVHREGHGALTQWQVPLLSQTSGSWSAASTGSAALSDITTAQHAFASAHLSLCHSEARPAWSYRPPADPTEIERIPERVSVLHRIFRLWFNGAPVLQPRMVIFWMKHNWGSHKKPLNCGSFCLSLTCWPRLGLMWMMDRLTLLQPDDICHIFTWNLSRGLCWFIETRIVAKDLLIVVSELFWWLEPKNAVNSDILKQSNILLLAKC